MKLKSVIDTDFVPMVKKPKLWITSRSLKKGATIDVEPEIGHQLLAAYPGAFEVISYGDSSPVRKQRIKQVKQEDLTELAAE